MVEYVDIWQFLAGLGVFLFGLYFVEQSLKNLAGRSFKRFLRTQTDTPLKGIIAGVVVTAILQSSSVVSLMVLAFVGAGILSLRNAIAIIFGTNLGTTFTGWIVTLLGFQVEIESFALPMLAVGGIFMVFFSKVEKLLEASRFLMGFGFLFIGLQYMKSSIDFLAGNIDIGLLEGVNPYLFFPIGLALTAIIQSSSAAMVITLSGLHAGIIPLDAAAILMVGSDLGTTVTVVLGAIKGTPAKKRVAASHVLFNLVTCLIALALVYPLLWFIGDVVGFSSPLYVLVAFHSSFNLLGLILLLPFVGFLSRLLERWFNEDENLCEHINKVPTTVPEAAIEALRKEIMLLIDKARGLNVQGLRLGAGSRGLQEKAGTSFFTPNKYLDKYASLKELEGEIVEYYLKIQNEKLEGDESEQLSRYTRALRNAIQSAKGIKDIEHNVREFDNSSNDAKLGLFRQLRERLGKFYLSVYQLFHEGNKAVLFESLSELRRKNHRNYEQFTRETYAETRAGRLSEIEISTLLNVNQEIYSANKALLLSMADMLMSRQEAEDFNRVPASG